MRREACAPMAEIKWTAKDGTAKHLKLRVDQGPPSSRDIFKAGLATSRLVSAYISPSLLLQTRGRVEIRAPDVSTCPLGTWRLVSS